MKTETIEVNGTDYLIKIHYENRRNARASIGKTAINIRVPLLLNREEQFKQIFQMKSWAVKRIQENPQQFKPEIQREYRDRDLLKIGDEQYNLQISYKNKQTSSARIIGNVIYFKIPSNLPKEMQDKSISALLSRCIASRRLPHLKEKINELNKKYFDQRLNKISFKYNRSNWGSCSRAGNINISTRLLFAPNDILEYVCIHELAHLIEHNHSDQFWLLIKKAMPNYKEKEQWLKENSNNCRF